MQYRTFPFSLAFCLASLYQGPVDIDAARFFAPKRFRSYQLIVFRGSIIYFHFFFFCCCCCC